MQTTHTHKHSAVCFIHNMLLIYMLFTKLAANTRTCKHQVLISELAALLFAYIQLKTRNNFN